jgi:hypothetical protein
MKAASSTVHRIGRAVEKRLRKFGKAVAVQVDILSHNFTGRNPGGRSFPSPDARLNDHFTFDQSNAAVRLFPIGADIKLLENARCLLTDDRTVEFTRDATGAVPLFFASTPNFETRFCAERPKISVILDLHDTPQDRLELSTLMWHVIRRCRLEVVYFKLQVHDRAAFRKLNRLPSQVHVISMPMLLGGSRFHITKQEDFEGDALFRRRLAPNPVPDYAYDWSWIGGETSPDRTRAMQVMATLDQSRAFVAWTQLGHHDARAATVKFDQYLDTMRRSHLCLSLNGNGPWCLKDGELFAHDAFCLRQDHPSLTLNPLSPHAGREIGVFKTEDLAAAIAYYLAETSEREAICTRGAAYLRAILHEHLYARVYAPRLEEFLRERRKEVWADLLLA